MKSYRPGHEVTSIAVYDRQTEILSTGDILYPGRFYINEPCSMCAVSGGWLILSGISPSHTFWALIIKNKRAPYIDYPVGATYQPDEHALELERSHLLELNEALIQMKGNLLKKVMRDFTISPRFSDNEIRERFGYNSVNEY